MSEWPSKQQEIWFQAGVTGERERIIKLLEADLCTNSEWGWTDCYGLNKEHCERRNEYIELIKGVTNE